MKTMLSVAILTLVSSSAMAANCAKNPNHSSCQQPPPPEVTIISTLPVVKDVNGNLIGRAFDTGWESWNPIYGEDQNVRRGYAQVRLTDPTGQHGYALRFYRDALAPGDNHLIGTLYWASSSCYGAPAGILVNNAYYPPNGVMTPYFSESYRVIWARERYTNYILGVGRLTPTIGQSTGLWAIESGDSCNGRSASTGEHATFYTITDFTNLADEYAGKAPFQFVAE